METNCKKTAEDRISESSSDYRRKHYGSCFKKLPSKENNNQEQMNKRDQKEIEKLKENDSDIYPKVNNFICLSKTKHLSNDLNQESDKENNKSKLFSNSDSGEAFSFIYEKKMQNQNKQRKLKKFSEHKYLSQKINNDNQWDSEGISGSNNLKVNQRDLTSDSLRNIRKENIFEKFKWDIESHSDLSKNSRLSVLTHWNSSNYTTDVNEENISNSENESIEEDKKSNQNFLHTSGKNSTLNSKAPPSEAEEDSEEIDENAQEDKIKEEEKFDNKTERFVFPRNLLDENPKSNNGEGVEGETYHIEWFLGRKINNKKAYYKVKWRGLDESEATWIKNKYLRPYSLAWSAFTNYSYKSSVEDSELCKSENPQKQMKKAIAQESSKIIIDKIRKSEGFEEHFYRKARFLFRGLNRISKIGRFEFGDKARKIINVVKSETNNNELMLRIDWHIRCNGFKPYSSVYSLNIVKKYNINVILDFYESKLKFL